MSKQQVAPPRPRCVRHIKRPEWGVGRVLDVFSGLIRVRFTDGATREFRDDVLEPVDESEATPELLALTETPPPPPVRTAKARARKAMVAKAAAKAAAALVLPRAARV